MDQVNKEYASFSGCSKRNFLVCTLLILLVVSCPVVFSKYPHLYDFPGHLARIKILSQYHDVDFYQSVYNVTKKIPPNIAFDVVVLFLQKFLPILFAGKLFIILTLIVTITGVISLHYVLYDRLSYWPLCSALLFYNLILQFGFLSYLFGVGLMFWGVAIWLRVSSYALWVRLLVAGMSCLILFYAHIIACGLYVLLISTIESQKIMKQYAKNGRFVLKNFLLVLLPSAGIVLFSYYFYANSGETSKVIFRNILVKIAMGIMNLSWPAGSVDNITIVGVMILAAVLIFGAYIRFAKEMIIPILALIVLFFIAPNKFGNGWHFDTRIPVVIIYIIIACSFVSFKSMKSLFLSVVVFSIILFSRSYFILQDWRKYDTVVDSYMEISSDIPPYSMVFLASDKRTTISPFPYGNMYWRAPIHHVVDYSVLNTLVFVPDIFAMEKQHTIVATDMVKDVYAYQENKAFLVSSKKDFEEIINTIVEKCKTMFRENNFTGVSNVYLLVLNFELSLAYQSDNAEIVSKSDRFNLYKIDNAKPL